VIRAFYSGKEGLLAQQLAVDNISNNIANVNTTGYKSRVEQFSDLLYSSMSRSDLPGYATELSGNGAALSALASDMTGGTTITTENLFDYSVNNDGFFCVKSSSGDVFYTRDGSFAPAQQQSGLFLETKQGLQVLDAQGKPIEVTAGKTTASPGIFTFSNSQGLTYAADNLFMQSNTSGVAVVSDEGFKTGYLEGSNVDLATQMTHLIVAQRGYQFSSRLVKAADDIAAMTNELR
jgi:flagellar basal-body rod protein FlgG